MLKVGMKKIIFFCCLSLMIVAVYFVSKSFSLGEKEPVYIAVVGPMKKSSGQAMKEALELYKEQINQQGGVDGRKVEFIFRDDQNDPKVAQRIAHTLAIDNKVLAVIGHYYGSTSFVAGKIYKKNGIPAVTASAGAEFVIRDNDWYFRTVPGNSLEAKFTANYIKKELKSKYTSIIFSNDPYGKSMLAEFKKAVARQGMQLTGTWQWESKKSSDEQVKIIQQGLTELADPGIIYLATHAQEGAKIIAALKESRTSYQIIGCYNFAKNFLNELKSYKKEVETPGYYSDDIFFVSPFMTTLSGVEGFEFEMFFYQKYHKIPGTTSACYYDAAHIVLQAIKTSGIHGEKHIREDRRNIRKALADMYNKDNGIKGATGNLWFDKNGGVQREYAVGFWKRQKELPAFIQYNQVNKKFKDILQGALEHKFMLTDGMVMRAKHIVHVGVENLKIINISKKKSEFTAEFKLRFRYPASFDTPSEGGKLSPLNFEFTNTSNAAFKLLKKETKNEITTQLIYLKPRKFRVDFTLMLPGVDHAPMFIGLRHAQLSDDDFMYVSEIDTLQADLIPLGWPVSDIFCYSDLFSKKTTLGVPAYFNSNHSINYSRFNIEIQLDM
ncbi:MAG: ABC transporter substrate-binding protein [Candidatus Electrothrix gigas]